MDFLIARDGRRHGPFSQEQLQQGLEEGWLGTQDLIWHEGLPDWRRIDEVFDVVRSSDAARTAANRMAPVAPFAAEPDSALPARTQVIKKTLPAQRTPGAGASARTGAAQEPTRAVSRSNAFLTSKALRWFRRAFAGSRGMVERR